MSADNFVTITGNITSDPELGSTNKGTDFVNFGIAVNRSFTNRDGERSESTSFFDVRAWQRLAANVSESFRKGDRVTVVGRLEQRSWETEDGQRRSAVRIVADHVAASVQFATVDGITKPVRDATAPPAAKPTQAPAPADAEAARAALDDDAF